MPIKTSNSNIKKVTCTDGNPNMITWTKVNGNFVTIARNYLLETEPTLIICQEKII